MKLLNPSNVIFAAALAACACDRANTERSSADNSSTAAERATAGNDAVEKSISVTGCLQNGNRGAFILTRMNEPSQRAGATGGSPAGVAQDQLNQAANSYRVDASDDVDLEALVGKQVRVNGTVSERADLPTATAGNSANAGDRDEIDQGDLAEIKATSASLVAEQCGGDANGSPAPSNR